MLRAAFLLPAALALVPAHERQALVDLYAATRGDAWRNNSGWLTGDPCDGWFGIFCSSDGAHVNEVFPNPRWSGNTLVGTIPPTFWNLTELEHIYLSNDRPGWSLLQGSLPTEIGRLHRLKCLYTSHAGNLSGPLPTELGSLTALQGLYLRWNSWSGPLPDLSRLRNLTKLIVNAAPVDDCAHGLCQSTLSGTLHVLAAARLPLEHLDIANNRFSGTFPEALCAIPWCTAWGNHFAGHRPSGCCMNSTAADEGAHALDGAAAAAPAQSGSHPVNNECHAHAFPGGGWL